jgi:hypothetical protein
MSARSALQVVVKHDMAARVALVVGQLREHLGDNRREERDARAKHNRVQLDERSSVPWREEEGVSDDALAEIARSIDCDHLRASAARCPGRS